MTLRILPAGAITPSVHHTFEDETLADVAANTDADEPALAEFSFEMSFDHEANRITRVELTMWLTIAMPEWTNVSGRPQAEQDEWARFLRALRHHEDGHIAIFRREAQTTYNRLTAATAKTINRVLNTERARIQRLSDAYDHTTDHGRTQQTPHGTTIINVP